LGFVAKPEGLPFAPDLGTGSIINRVVTLAIGNSSNRIFAAKNIAHFAARNNSVNCLPSYRIL
jgi:hypothetical protein